MAVEAHHMNIFSPQLISNKDCVKLVQNMYHGEFNNVSGETPLITGGESFAVDPFASFNKSESGLTYNLNTCSAFPPSTKRPRGSHFSDSNARFASAFKRRSVAFGSSSSSSSLLNPDVVSQIQNQQQTEIVGFVAQQTEKLRIEIEARQQTQTRMLASAVQNVIAKKLKERDEEIARLRNLNWVLQERVKNICAENQIWRDIAQTNEANANNLRTNLDQALAQIETFQTASAAVEDYAESSCGSCCDGDGGETVNAVRRDCKQCGEREASVLLLPCRHLCLCTFCGSALVPTCPVCDSVMNASVHVNMSS